MDALRNELLGALIGLARASESKVLLESSGEAFIDGLVLAFKDQISKSPLQDSEVSSPNPDSSACAQSSVPGLSQVEIMKNMISRLHAEKKLMAPDCAACQYPCGRTEDYNMEEIYGASKELSEAKLTLFSLLGDIAVKSKNSEISSPYSAAEIQTFISEALFQISCTYDAAQLTDVLEKAKNMC